MWRKVMQAWRTLPLRGLRLETKSSLHSLPSKASLLFLEIGDRCGEEKCPLGYACHALIDESCEEDSSASHGTFYFGLTSDKEDT